MQLDMHYYGTYAMARAAGINSNASATIATAAQFVDDNTAQSHVTFGDGARIDKESTAHPPCRYQEFRRPRPTPGLGAISLHSWKHW